jgi:hypothetical protein
VIGTASARFGLSTHQSDRKNTCRCREYEYDEPTYVYPADSLTFWTKRMIDEDIRMRSCVWYRVHLSSDQISAGHVHIICQRFTDAVSAAGSRDGACLFATSHDTRSERLREDAADRAAMNADALFFSPESISLIPDLLAAYGAEPSEPPERVQAALLVGRPRDWELLPHSSH